MRFDEAWMHDAQFSVLADLVRSTAHLDVWWHPYPLGEMASLVGPDRGSKQKAGQRHA
jgi:hypothetical protein